MNLKNIILGIAIIILTLFVTIYGINTLYPKPEYNDFCPGDVYRYGNQVDCVNNGGEWITYESKCVGLDCPVPTQPTGNCQPPYSCQEAFDKASQDHYRSVFFIALPLGIIIIALGAFLFSLEAVGVGLMGGGVGTLIYGIGGYWRYTENWIRFIISLIGLIILIFLAYFFNKKFKKK